MLPNIKFWPILTCRRQLHRSPKSIENVGLIVLIDGPLIKHLVKLKTKFDI